MWINTAGTIFALSGLSIEFSSGRVMKNSEPSISQETAPEVFALAAQLYKKKNQDYSLSELMQAGAEVQIPPELIQQAFEQLKAQSIQAQERQQKRKLILTSSLLGAAIALGSLWIYNAVAGNFTTAQRNSDINLEKADLREPNPQRLEPPVPPEASGTTFTGKVQQYLLNPEGKVDGILLSNGLQAKFPPHMGDSLASTIAPGMTVDVSGTPGIPTRFGQEVKAYSITNSQTKQTVVEQPPTAKPQPPLQSNYSNLSVTETAQQWLVGHRGEINGVILSNGAIVKFPPHVGMQLLSFAKAGDKVQAEGFGTRSRYGQVLQATTLTVNGQLVPFDPPKPKKAKMASAAF